VKYPSIVVDDERSIGHWFIKSNSDKLVKPRFKVHEKSTNMLKDYQRIGTIVESNLHDLQNGKYAWCKGPISFGQVIEIDHIVPNKN
jgi:hypothetical protein